MAVVRGGWAGSKRHDLSQLAHFERLKAFHPSFYDPKIGLKPLERVAKGFSGGLQRLELLKKGFIAGVKRFERVVNAVSDDLKRLESICGCIKRAIKRLERLFKELAGLY